MVIDERDLTQQERSVFLSHYGRAIVKTNINMVVPWWLMAGYAYYSVNDNFITDDFYDELSEMLRIYGAIIQHPNKDLINLKEMSEGTTLSGFNVDWVNVPLRIRGATNVLLDMASGRSKLPMGDIIDLRKKKIQAQIDYESKHAREFFEGHANALKDLPYPINMLSKALLDSLDAVPMVRNFWGFGIGYEVGPDIVAIQHIYFTSQAIRIMYNEELDQLSAPVFADFQLKLQGKETAEIHDITPPIDVLIAYLFTFDSQKDLSMIMPIAAWVKFLSDDGFRIHSYDMHREDTKVLEMKICKEGSWEIDITVDLNVLVKDNDTREALLKEAGEKSPE